MGIAVEPPDINVSDANFTPHGNAIRFGLAAVKNVGRNAIESIVAARKELGKFQSFFEFCEKVDLRLLNRRRSTFSQNSKNDWNFPSSFRAATMLSIAFLPTFFTAASPKRIALPCGVKFASLTLM